MELSTEIKDAINSISSIAKRSIGLSEALGQIAAEDSPYAFNITRTAQHLTDLSNLTQQLGELLALTVEGYYYTETLLNDAGVCIRKLDRLVSEFEIALTSVNEQRSPKKLIQFFKNSNIDDLTRLIVDPIKKPLEIIITHLRIASRYPQAKRGNNITALLRECEFAESRVEGSKYVINALVQAQKQHRRGGYDYDQLDQLADESWGKTAKWMYQLIFARTLDSVPAAERLSAQGHAETVRTTDDDSKEPAKTSSESSSEALPLVMMRELLVIRGLNRLAVNELLLYWTALQSKDVRQLTNVPRDSESIKLQQAASFIAKWLEHDQMRADDSHATETNGSYHAPKIDEGSGSDDTTTTTEDSSDEGEVALKNANSNQSSRAANGHAKSKDTSTKLDRYEPGEENKKNDKKNVDSSSWDADWKTIEPEVRKRKDILHVPELDEEDKGKWGKKGESSRGESSQTQKSALRSTRQEASSKTEKGGTSEEAQKSIPRSVTINLDDLFKGKANFEEKDSQSRHRGTSRSRASQNHRSSSKLGADDDTPSDDKHSVRRPRQDGARQKKSSASELRSEIEIPREIPRARGRNSLPPLGKAESMIPTLGYGHFAFGPYPYPSAIHPSLAPHYSMAAFNASQSRPYHQESSANGNGDMKLVKLIEQETKERKDAEELQKEEKRKLERQNELREEEIQQLRKSIEQMKERTASFEALEKEKRAMEQRLKERDSTEEDVQEMLNKATMNGQEHISKLYREIEKLHETARRNASEWATERKEIEANAQEERINVIDRYQEELETQLENAAETYEAKIEEEKAKTRAADALAQRWVKHYHEAIGRYEQDDEESEAEEAEKSVNSRPQLDPFQFQVKGRAGNSGADNSTICEPVAHTLPIDEKNPWEGQESPFDRARPQPAGYQQYQARTRTIQNTNTPDQSGPYRILFPPRTGWDDSRPSQLSNYLASTGFKAEFEIREPTRFQNTASSGNVLRGTLFWLPPTSTAEAELYKSLRNCGWRPTYVRTTSSGQTWFFGCQPIHAQFFSDMYKPQLGPVESLPHTNIDRESLIISKDLIETDELDSLGHMYKEQGNRIFLDPVLTAEDIDHIVARSFLAREGRYRKMFRKTNFRFDLPKTNNVLDVVEVESLSGETVSSSSTREEGNRRLSLWPLWGSWSLSGG